MVLFAAALLGCVSVPKLPEVPNGERITVRYAPGGPVCFDCESLEIVMTSDGQAVWTYGHGSWDKWSQIRRRLPFSPLHYEAWRDHLAQFRPKGGQDFSADSEQKTCDVAFHDVPGRSITWETAEGTDWLNLDLGCDPEKHAELLKFFAEFPLMIGIRNPPKVDQWVAATPAQ
jgi:hypothetical protein